GGLVFDLLGGGYGRRGDYFGALFDYLDGDLVDLFGDILLFPTPHSAQFNQLFPQFRIVGIQLYRFDEKLMNTPPSVCIVAENLGKFRIEFDLAGRAFERVAVMPNSAGPVVAGERLVTLDEAHIR